MSPQGKLNFSRIALGALILLVLVVVFILIQLLRVPVVTDLYPRLGAPGEILVLEGMHFGTERGTVYMAGERITQSFYLEWGDRKISLRIPQGIRSGLVHVETRLGRSNGLLYAHKSQVPVPLAAEPAPAATLRVSASEVRRGQVLDIFSPRIPENRGQVELYWQNPATVSGIPGVSSAVARELFPAIRAWKSGTAKLVVPSSAETGSIVLRFPDGTSESARVIVTRPAWANFLENPVLRRTITLRYGVEAVLWPGAGDPVRGYSGVFRSSVPLLASSEWLSPGAVGVESLDDAQLQVERGYSVALLPSITQRRDWMHVLTASAELRGGRWDIDERLVNSSLAGFEEETAPYLRLDSVFFAASGYSRGSASGAGQSAAANHAADSMRVQARSILGAQTNLLRRARLIWDWVLARLGPSEAGRRVGIADIVPRVMEPGQDIRANSWGYSLLLAGMLRAADIPARIEQGLLLLDGDVLVPHTWVSFFIPELGWVSADAALADGLHGGQKFLEGSTPAAYFAASDGRHIGFGAIGQGIYSPWEYVSPEGTDVWFDPAGPLAASPRVRIDKPVWIPPVLVSDSDQR